MGQIIFGSILLLLSVIAMFVIPRLRNAAKAEVDRKNAYTKDKYDEVTEFNSSGFTTASWVARVVAVIGTVVLFTSCIVFVPYGHVGVVIDMQDIQPVPLDAGPHFVKPWVSVVNMDIRVQNDVEAQPAETFDTQSVTIKMTMNWRPEPSNMPKLLSQYGLAYDKAIENKQVEEQKALQKNYELQRVETEAKMAAATAKGEADSRVARATGEAESVKLAAHAEAEALQIRGEAQASFNQKVSQSLSPLLIQSDYLKRWDGKLPMYTVGAGSGTMLMLPTPTENK